MSFCHMRIARPVSELDTTASMYCAGLGLELLGSFTDHEGFSGIMLGAPEAGWHLEFTHCRHHPVTPRQAMKICWCCTIRSRRHGRHSAQPWTPPDFCALRRLTLTGRSMASLFVDRDGYRTVLQNRAWGMVCDSSGMAAS
ncbi:prolyl endopeptidase [Klebsiella pneumoniae subsp. ozaenae]|uniref:Prolyl endopeptidase n=1 Tax=Klebsiella pneumoniae subsp. ozaenae TaxID=574 RepID=A0A377ZM82_KLEPO|nr:prolyl endopeptidase [Klebsiella pneumoniae subsp. ozaenae]